MGQGASPAKCRSCETHLLIAIRGHQLHIMCHLTIIWVVLPILADCYTDPLVYYPEKQCLSEFSALNIRVILSVPCPGSRRLVAGISLCERTDPSHLNTEGLYT